MSVYPFSVCVWQGGIHLWNLNLVITVLSDFQIHKILNDPHPENISSYPFYGSLQHVTWTSIMARQLAIHLSSINMKWKED